eukprot:TRINITY_DN80250_c0_g1_i1.p1 TRINITY_DN80250_c0_g1~~TRINITY_DN80250_c0_g1_i1.p1  ORF type:complete len:380 (+),score=61.67 TRINITY_DN80250_c0_g1_i1:84-1142(+)
MAPALHELSTVEYHVVGDALVDVLASGLDSIPDWGGDAFASGIHMRSGGSAFTTAVHLKAMVGNAGSSVTFHGCVGSDAQAQMLRLRLEHAGVIPSLTECSDLPTGSCIVLSGCKDRAFITCLGASGSMTVGHLKSLEAAVRRQQSKHAAALLHVHFGGFYAYSAQMREELPACIAMLRSAAVEHNRKLTVSAEVNGSSADNIAGIAAIFDNIDFFKGNVDEIKAVAAAMAGSEESTSGYDDDDLFSHFPVEVALVATAGGRGARFRAGPPENSASGYVKGSTVDVKDTTGAGDACTAAVLAYYIRGLPLAEALARGCAAGALNCQHLGGCEVPLTSQAIEGFVENVDAATA